MKIAIVGASAGIGLAAVQQALTRGHEVTALSTNASQIPDHALLRKIDGSATSAADMQRVMEHVDAVLITIGTKNKKPNTLFLDTARSLVAAGTALNFKGPVLVITGFGAGESKGYHEGDKDTPGRCCRLFTERSRSTKASRRVRYTYAIAFMEIRRALQRLLHRSLRVG